MRAAAAAVCVQLHRASNIRRTKPRALPNLFLRFSEKKLNLYINKTLIKFEMDYTNG